jgi:hypothetical protein
MKIYNVKEKLKIIPLIVIIPMITFNFSNRFYYQNHIESKSSLKFSYTIYFITRTDTRTHAYASARIYIHTL